MPGRLPRLDMASCTRNLEPVHVPGVLATLQEHLGPPKQEDVGRRHEREGMVSHITHPRALHRQAAHS